MSVALRVAAEYEATNEQRGRAEDAQHRAGFVRRAVADAYRRHRGIVSRFDSRQPDSHSGDDASRGEDPCEVLKSRGPRRSTGQRAQDRQERQGDQHEADSTRSKLRRPFGGCVLARSPGQQGCHDHNNAGTHEHNDRCDMSPSQPDHPHRLPVLERMRRDTPGVQQRPLSCEQVTVDGSIRRPSVTCSRKYGPAEPPTTALDAPVTRRGRGPRTRGTTRRREPTRAPRTPAASAGCRTPRDGCRRRRRGARPWALSRPGPRRHGRCDRIRPSTTPVSIRAHRRRKASPDRSQESRPYRRGFNRRNAPTPRRHPWRTRASTATTGRAATRAQTSPATRSSPPCTCRGPCPSPACPP